jgi:hypothetical protein
MLKRYGMFRGDIFTGGLFIFLVIIGAVMSLIVPFCKKPIKNESQIPKDVPVHTTQ